MRMAGKHLRYGHEMRLYLARHRDIDITSIVVLVGSAWITYMWGASSATAAARQANPNQLQHWTAM